MLGRIPSRSWCVRVLVILACLVAASAVAQTAWNVRGAAAIAPLLNESPAKISVDPPLAEPLSRGLVVIPYRTAHLRMVPVFGHAALAVSPRIGHIHVSVDDAPWVWVDASGEPVMIHGLTPGVHKVLIRLQSANHQLLDQGAVTFTVPEAPMTASPSEQTPRADARSNEPPAKIIIDAPRAEPLSRGVVFIPYRTEGLQIVPVFGPAALAVSPPIGHIQVSVDDAAWHWADASGVPVIINGLTPGRHTIVIQLVNANHQQMDRDTVQVTVPAAKPSQAHSLAEAKPKGDPNAIRPFRVHFSDAELADLKRRIAATRWPGKEIVKDQSQGVQLATVQKLARDWAEYDWRKCEARLNALPQFMTTIDGVDIHFIHVRSKLPDALPMILTHGWPGSIIEHLKIIELLTNPTAHGGTEVDAFDVVIPSLPGYGFSGKPATTGWDPVRIARAWIVLMERLGYTRYVAQGGDWGNAVTEQMALLTPPGLIGIHTNMPATVPAEINTAALAGAPTPSGLSAEEEQAYDQLAYFYKHGLGYANEMSNRPQTLYGIEDSPVGLAAWMMDHDAQSLALISRVFDGQAEGLTPEDILDNVTLYWLTNTAVSSARLYWESKLAFFAPKNVLIPTAVSAFPEELYQAPRSWTEKAYPKLIYYNRLEKGGHFAAWEQPKALSVELRAAFKSLRARSVRAAKR